MSDLKFFFSKNEKTFSKMQDELIKKLFLEGQNCMEIQKELDRKFGEQAYKQRTIYKHLEKLKLGLPQGKQLSPFENHIDEQLLITIQQEVGKNEFFSVRSLAHKLNVAPTLIYRYLSKYLHLVFKHTKWIPHQLNSSQKKERQEKSLELFQVLEKSKHNGYRDIITGDQSWFIYNYSPTGAWVLQDDEAPVYSNDHICIEKMMITVIWGVWGVYIVDELPEGEHLNSSYFVEHILIPLEAQKDQIWPQRGKHKIWLHLDNCKVHNSKYTQLEIEKSVFKRAPHPPYSPDIAPSDFFLFGYVKDKLEGQSFTEREALYEAISNIIQEIPFEMKRKVFDHWAFRCQWVSSHEGLYFQK